MNIAQGGELPNTEATLSPMKHYCRKIRRQGQVSAEMLGKILTKGCNRRERFIADPDEPGVLSASGHDLTIIGQATFYVKFDIIQNPKKMRVLVCKEEGDEILIDVQSLVSGPFFTQTFQNHKTQKTR